MFLCPCSPAWELLKSRMPPPTAFQAASSGSVELDDGVFFGHGGSAPFLCYYRTVWQGDREKKERFAKSLYCLCLYTLLCFSLPDLS